ncbi:MAG: quinoprotein relay system zinc metallohydrolase 2 [Betaproteobacteria bacterium]|nr:quinoprotein relay system zinc metallohydrolase 2 [Betaproteobacteria bacterium]
MSIKKWSFALCLLPLMARTNASSDFELQEIAPGVFVHAGKIEERAPGNMGDQANIGFILGARCVAVIDTGGSIVIGQRLRAAIRQRTALPVCYVINTHVHPDHVFGNAAFKDDGATFVGHERLPKAMAVRARNFTRSLVRDLGEPVAASTMIPPTLTVADTLTLDLGGRKILLRAFPIGHSDSDISIWDERTGTIWLSDLLFLDHTPAIDGSVLGWLAVIEDLKKLPAKRAVPGHGPAAVEWPQAMQAQEAYLRLIVGEIRTALKKRRTIEQAIEEVGYSEQGKWREFENFHRRNVTTSYVELEWED